MKRLAKGFLVLLAILLSISLVTAYFFVSQPKENASSQHTFNLSLSSIIGTIIQGGSAQINVKLTSYAKNLNFSLSAISNSSDLEYAFAPATGKENFTSSLTITAPTATPSSYYLVNITATNGEITQTVSYTLGVLSAKVHFNGSISGYYSSAPNKNGKGVTVVFQYPFIEFLDTASLTNYTSALHSSSLDSLWHYTISLDNGHTYNASIYYVESLNIINFYENNVPLPSYTDQLGSLDVFAPVGNDTQTQSFSVTP